MKNKRGLAGILSVLLVFSLLVGCGGGGGSDDGGFPGEGGNPNPGDEGGNPNGGTPNIDPKELFIGSWVGFDHNYSCVNIDITENGFSIVSAEYGNYTGTYELSDNLPPAPVYIYFYVAGEEIGSAYIEGNTLRLSFRQEQNPHYPSYLNFDCSRKITSGTYPEGVYIGIVKFAENSWDITGGSPILLDQQGQNKLNGIIDFQIRKSENPGTTLFHSVHKAIANLTTNEALFPNELQSVNIITFTDGLDTTSASLVTLYPEEQIEGQSFANSQAYGTYVNQQITNRDIADLPITAYSIGIKGSDVTDETRYVENLESVASPDLFYPLNNFDQLQTTFDSIADQLTVVSTTTNFTLSTGIFESGTKVRMTFDVYDTDTTAAAASLRYIEGTMTLSGSTYTLNNITYSDGISTNEGAGPITGTLQGTNVSFKFNNIKGYYPVIDANTGNTRQWTMVPGATVWSHNSEYSTTGSSDTNTELKSTIIYLVLDVSMSLSDSEVGQIQSAANNFINNIYYKINPTDSDSGLGSSENPVPLEEGEWMIGSLPIYNNLYYYFPVESGKTYRVWWNDSTSNEDNRTGYITVSGTCNGSLAFSAATSGWNNPQTYDANQNGTLILQVSTSYSASDGNFSIVYTEDNSTRPN